MFSEKRNEPRVGKLQPRHKSFSYRHVIKKSLTAIVNGFKCGTETIDNLGTNFNEQDNK